MITLAKRLQSVQPSPSMVAAQAAKKLIAEGVDIIRLELGEPDFMTPEHVVTATFDQVKSRRMLYTVPLGMPELRKAVVDKFIRENSVTFELDEIAVTNGAKQLIFNAFMATLNAGDEVIVPAPYFVSYPDLVKLFDGVPVVVECNSAQQFKLTPEQLEQAITPHTKWLMLNTPSNPTGAVYSRTELKALGEVLAQHPQVMILSDEIYEHIIYVDEFTSFASACPKLRERTLIVNGVSKAYAMTGWRVGYAGGPRDLIKAMATIQSQCCTSVSEVAQIAAYEALQGSQQATHEFCQAFRQRRDLVMDAINQIDGLSLVEPEGAFYAYVKCADLIGATTPKGETLNNDVDVSRYLLEEAHVSSVPGAAYGLSPFFRISTATSEELLQKAVQRIKQAVECLSAK